MQVTRASRRLLRLQNILFAGLFIAIVGLLAWLSTRYVYDADWTVAGRNSLSTASARLLDNMEGPIKITAYASDNRSLRQRIQDIVGRYQRHKDDVQLVFEDPFTHPERVRELGISVDGMLNIEYNGRSEKLEEPRSTEYGPVSMPTETGISNVLQRLARAEQRWIVFLTGHGERDPHGEANHDLGLFGADLARKGLTVQTVNLTESPSIPDNTTMLVIAGPTVDLLPGEVAAIQKFIDRGGNLLWLAEPEGLHGLAPIAEHLGVHLLPGVVVDADTQLYGIDNPSFVLISDYAFHPAARDFKLVTLFPETAALEVNAPEPWQAQDLLRTQPRSWTETGPLEGEIRFNSEADEHAGPLTIGVSLTRPRPATDDGKEQGEQRIVIIGDGDFLSNQFIGNSGNQGLGLNLINWLSHDEGLLSIDPATTPDTRLSLSDTQMMAIGLGWFAGVPILLLATGVTLWLRRRRR